MRSIVVLFVFFTSASACRKADVVATKDTVDAAKRADASVGASTGGGESYFPLVVDARYEYDAEFGGKRSHVSILVRSADAIAGRVFYFVDASDVADASDSNPIVGTESFGLGAYRANERAIETGAAFWLTDVPNVSALQTAVQLPPVSGATVTLEDDGHQLEVRVVGTETVKVPAGSFSCLRLDEREIWPTNVHEGAVWLARGVGVVRRVYTTGRTEELTSVRFP
jgi:hypothetical protein